MNFNLIQKQESTLQEREVMNTPINSSTNTQQIDKNKNKQAYPFILAINRLN